MIPIRVERTAAELLRQAMEVFKGMEWSSSIVAVRVTAQNPR